ncbi:MAG: hypothetical protein M3N37_00140 [Actinomycetota bacterium]|nr:hypothetical protein [Actinomycetota bacterium]
MPKLLLEPPDPNVPPRSGSLAALGPLRLSAAGAATVLALSSTGHIGVLVALLAVLVAQPLAVGAVLLAGLAVLERWGSPSLEAVAGAQSVLGAGGVVGPATAAASAWFAAAALVLASPRAGGGDDGGGYDVGGPDAPVGSQRRGSRAGALVVALATGSAAALVVAGPELAVDLPVRLGATAAAVVVAAVVSSQRWQYLSAGLALAAAVAAAALGATVTTGRVGL